MPDILVVPLFQVSPQAQLLHGKIYYIADRHGESHSRQSSCAKSAAHVGVIARHDVVSAQAPDLQAVHLGHEGTSTYYSSPKWLFDAGCKGFE
jgi:hypothetical protein